MRSRAYLGSEHQMKPDHYHATVRGEHGFSKSAQHMEFDWTAMVTTLNLTDEKEHYSD
jgi:hypothetical protein